VSQVPKLGICVLNWNAGSMLTTCVDYITRANRQRSHLLVVFDNHSSDNSIEELTSALPDIKVIRNGENLGYAKGNNRGAQYLLAHGCDTLLFLNPDVFLEENSCTALLDTLNGGPTVACVGGLSFNDDGISRMAARTKPTPMEKLVLYGPLHRIPQFQKYRSRHFLATDSLHDGALVYTVTGACLLFRSQAFEEIGGFDESTFLYEEELIVAERLRQAGWSIALSKACRYFHAEAHSTDLIPYKRRLHFIRSEQHLLNAYYRWPLVNRSALQLWRLIEWGVYAMTWFVRKQIAMRSKPSSPNQEPQKKLRATEALAPQGKQAWRQ